METETPKKKTYVRMTPELLERVYLRIKRAPLGPFLGEALELYLNLHDAGITDLVRQLVRLDTAAAPIDQWSKEVIHGVGGLVDYETYEVIAFNDRDVEVTNFVLRCLANPKCKGSGEVLSQILARRASRLDGAPEDAQ